MTDKVPIRTVFDSSGNATGLAEFQSGETVGHIHGGTGLSSLGSAGQVLRVNGAGSAIEFGDGFSTSSGDITLDSAADIILDADGADIILKDGGTEFGRFTNNSGELRIKSGSSATTNITMSGANTTIAGNLTVTGTTEGDGNITIGDAATDTVTFNGTISGNLVFEGSTGDSFETTLAPGNPSSDITLTLPSSASDTLVGKTTTDTLTNKTLTTPIITEIDSGSTITLDATTDIVLDADGGDVFLKDAGTTYGSLTNTSGNLIIKSGTTTALTFSGANITAAGNVGVDGNLTVTGTTTFNGGTITIGDAATDTVAFNGTISTNLIFEGSTGDSFETTLAPGNPSADITLTLPSSGSDTLVGKATTDTLTNKSIDLETNTLTGSLAEFNSALQSESFAGLAASQTLTNKTINSNANTLHIDLDDLGTFTGTLTEFNSGLQGDSFVSLTGSETLTNKTLTSPAITTPAITGNTTTTGNIIFEGSTADSFETTLTVADPTADRTITIPNATATLATTTDVFFGNSTTTSHPAASGDFDMAQSEAPFESVTDAFAVANGTVYDQMDPRGSSVSVDLGSVA